MLEIGDRRYSPETSIELVNVPPYTPDNLAQYDRSVQEIVDKSHIYDAAYNRWQTVRHLTATPISGLEGYLVGQNLTPNEIKAEIEQMGEYVLNGIIGTKSKYWDTLTGEKIHNGALIVLSEKFAGLLAINRARALRNREAQEFHDLLVAECTKPIEYSHNTHWSQRLILPKLQVKLPEFEIPLAYPSVLDPSKSYDRMLLIGRVGHPLVRASLKGLNSTERNLYLRSLY